MIIKNGLVIDPASGLSEKMDLLIEDGIIKEMASLITKEGEEVLDAAGLVVAPGLIDTHVHFRDPGFTYKETIHTGALASAKGGFTSVICMANTSPTVDSVPVLKDNLSRASKEKIRIFQAASISCNLKGQEETDMDALKEAGACGFTDDGIPLLNAEFCFHAMEKAAKLNVPVSLHEEDPSFIRNNGISHGKVSDALGIYGSPSIAEESLVARDCMLALKSGADVVIQHISSGISVDLVRTYKKMGAKLHAEATPHHFTLTEDAVLEHGTLAKMNPPLNRKGPSGDYTGTCRWNHRLDCHRPCTAQQRRKSKTNHRSSKRNHRFGNITGARDHFSCTQRASVTYAASRKNDDQSRQTVSFRRRKNRKGRSCRPRDLRSRSKMDS